MRYEINYPRVISQVKSIEHDAGQLDRQVKLMIKMEEDCSKAWQGKAASTFMTKLSALRDEIDWTAKQITQLASTIKSCADDIQRAEEEADIRASTLTTGQ